MSAAMITIGARSARRAAIVGLLFLAAAPLLPGRAKGPDWLGPCLSPEAAAWHARAAAVVLLDQVEVKFLGPQQAAYHVCGAIRANTKSGFERLRTALMYNPDYMQIDTARAWLVAPNGEVTNVPRREFMDTVATLDTHFWDNRRILSYSAASQAEVGTVFAWEFSFQAPADFRVTGWRAETGLALWKGSFDVTPPPGCVLAWHRRSPLVPDPVTGATPGSLAWRLERLPPLGADRPTGFFPQPVAIDVRCQPPGSPEEKTADGWARVAHTLSEIIEPRAQVTPAVQACAQEVVRDRTNRWDRIRSLTEFVQKKVVYLSITLEKDSLTGLRPHAAADVLRDRMGDCKDKATLLVALLRAIGEGGHVILVLAGSPVGVDPEWPTQQFNHAIVGIAADADTPAWWPTADFGALGRLVLFDPTAPDIPLGCLPGPDQNGRVLAVAATGGTLAVVPGDPVDYAGVFRTTSVTLAANGDAAIQCEEQFQGLPGAEREQERQVLGAQRFGQELERRFHARQTEVRDLKWTADWDPLAVRSTLHADFRAEQVGQPIGSGQMLLASLLPWINVVMAPWKTMFDGVSRMPVANFDEVIRIHLPPGCTVAELPGAVHLEHNGTKADFEFAQEAGTIVCHRRFLHPAVLMDKAEYDAVRVLVDKLEQADRRPIVLRLPPEEPRKAPAT